MATGKRVWTSETFIEGDATPTFTTLSGTTEELSSTVDMATNGYDLVHIWPDVNFDATPTDDVWFRLYSSSDGGTDWDDVAFYEQLLDSATDPQQILVVLKDPPPTWRAGFQQTGSTDSHDVRCSYKASNWSIA